MSKDLEAKAKVALDLLDQGAEEVNIIGTDLKVVRKVSSAKPQHPQAGNVQIVNVNVQAQAIARSSANLVVRLNIVRVELREIFKGSSRLPEIEKQLDTIEKELPKASPNKNTLKKTLRWALDFGWDVFLKIAPIIMDKLTLVP